MKQDKIQEAYEKILNEATKFKYMGKANDAMANFLEELEDATPDASKTKGSDLKKAKLIKLFYEIDKDWENLWNKINILAKQL